MELSQFEQLCRNCQVKDNNARQAAENVLIDAREKFPDQYVTYLFHIVRRSPDEQLRIFAAVMLRTAFLQSDTISSIYFQLSPTVQASCKAEVLAALQEERNRTVFRKICDLLGVMGSSILSAGSSSPHACMHHIVTRTGHGGSWPELLPWLFDKTKSPDAHMREGALNTFSQIAMLLGTALKSCLRGFFDIMRTALADPESAQVSHAFDFFFAQRVPSAISSGRCRRVGAHRSALCMMQRGSCLRRLIFRACSPSSVRAAGASCSCQGRFVVSAVLRPEAGASPVPTAHSPDD